LSPASSQTVSVTCATADGSAMANADYTPLPATVLTFAPGQTSQTVVVPVLGDTLAEPNETFLLNLTNPVNAVLGDAQGVGTIIDDDGTFIARDGFGYEAYSFPGEALDLVAGSQGVSTLLASGNNATAAVALSGGATFNFYGTTYTSLFVSANGLITFGSAN